MLAFEARLGPWFLTRGVACSPVLAE